MVGLVITEQAVVAVAGPGICDEVPGCALKGVRTLIGKNPGSTEVMIDSAAVGPLGEDGRCLSRC